MALLLEWIVDIFDIGTTIPTLPRFAELCAGAEALLRIYSFDAYSTFRLNQRDVAIETHAHLCSEWCEYRSAQTAHTSVMGVFAFLPYIYQILAAQIYSARGEQGLLPWQLKSPGKSSNVLCTVLAI